MMKTTEWISAIQNGTCAAFTKLYAADATAKERFTDAIHSFEKLYGKDREIAIFSVPGRSEIAGNHTDHNLGCVLAGAIDRDIIAIAAKNDDGVIRVQSEGYREINVSLEKSTDPKNFDGFCSTALVAGVAGGFQKNGHKVGGFDAYTTTRVLKGSGLSSSAAFEVMIGNILNHLYNDATIPNPELAKIAQYSENEYFGKPCGLMDQMACAVGGFVFIDFADPKNPIIEPINFSLTDAGYSLAIINTGGSHSDLNDDYASVPTEMKKVAAYFGRPVLRGTTEEEIIANAAVLRRALGDRAVLRALHFIRENDRVLAQADALRNGNTEAFLAGEIASGRSSFEYLQKVYTNKNVAEQGLSLALAIAEGALASRGGAWRVHGGGFAGTIQSFVRTSDAEEYARLMDSVFGKGACMLLSIRTEGAIRILP